MLTSIAHKWRDKVMLLKGPKALQLFWGQGVMTIALDFLKLNTVDKI